MKIIGYTASGRPVGEIAGGSGSVCPNSVQVCLMFVCRLKADNTFATGLDAMYVTDTLATLEWTEDLSAGDDLESKNGCGTIKVAYKSDDQLKRITTTLTVTTVDPELTEILVGQDSDVITDGMGNSRGLRGRSVGGPSAIGVSIEAWTRNVDADGNQDGTFPWVRWVLPKTKWNVDKRTLDSTILVPGFVGFGYENPAWATGPLGNWEFAKKPTRCYNYVLEEDIPTPVCGWQSRPAS